MVKHKETTLNQVELDLAAAADFVDLNNLEAQKILTRAQDQLGGLEKLGDPDPRIGEYRQKVVAILSKVAKVSSVPGPRLVYDFELSQKGISPRATNLTGRANEVFLGNQDSGSVWSVKIGNPETATEVSFGPLKSLSRLAAFGDRLSILDGDGVRLVNLKKGTVKNSAVTDLAVSEISDFVNYGGNLYFLNTTKNQIQKAVATSEGFGRVTNWLKEPTNLEQAKGLAVNGFVFVHFTDGRILKFEGGRPVDFSLSGLGQKLTNDVFIYTASGLSDLYLVEPLSLKIYKFTDLGLYQKTYDLLGSPLKSIDSLYVNATSRLYLLSGGKVYEVEP